MTETRIEVVPTGAALGAEIRGVDLSRPLSEAVFRQIAEASAEHAVIFFRDQVITPEDQIAFSKRFGELELLIFSRFTLKDHPAVLLISNVQEDGKYIGIHDAGREWHADSTYVPNPSMASFLYAKEVPTENGRALGDTLFVRTTGLLESFSPELQRKLSGLTSIHRMDARLITDPDKRPPEAIHPVIVTHPRTGRKCLFVNEGRTVGFPELDEEEGRPLLAELLDRLKAPERIYRHSWRVGDLLMWDNIAAQHHATHDYAWPAHRRLMHRTTVKGVVLS